MDPSTSSIITTGLAVGGAVYALLFGFTVFKLSQVFATKSQFDEYKQLAERDRRELREELSRQAGYISRLQQRTSHLKRSEDES